VELALTFLAQEDEKGVRRAQGQLGQIVLVSEGDVVILVDERNAAAGPALEQAIYLAARCAALMGDGPARDLLVKAYQQRFPQGRHAEDILKLPTAKYTAPAAGPTAVVPAE
jgi:hypothetical protein